LYHSTLGLRVIKKKKKFRVKSGHRVAFHDGPGVALHGDGLAEGEFFIDNLLVRIHFLIMMIRWTGLAPWGLPRCVP